MFCCVFGLRLFFTNLLFFAIFPPARFCVHCVCLCPSHSWLISRWPPSALGPFSFPDPLGVLSFSPAVRVQPHVRSDVVGSAGHGCCGLPAAPQDWQGLGHTVQELRRLGPPEPLCE